MNDSSALNELLKSLAPITPGQREILARGALATALEALAAHDVSSAKVFIVEAYHQLILRGDNK